MSNPKRIKLPNGKVINCTFDPLSQYLKEPDFEGVSENSAAFEQDYYQSEQLEGKRPNILIFGAGAVGSHLAFSLSSVCDCDIFLVDFDKVDKKHTRRGRTIYSPQQAGEYKVYAARDIIEQTYPECKVHCYPFDVMELEDGAIESLACQSQVVINAVDDPKAMLKVNALLYPVIETLFVALHRRADTGHIILTIPFSTACLRCCMQIDKPDDIRTLHNEPGLSLDIKNITNYSAVIALEIIKSKLTGKTIDRWDIDKNIFYFANTKEQQISPDGPGIYMQTGQRRKNCPVCSTSSSIV